jgi:hypothetical protein
MNTSFRAHQIVRLIEFASNELLITLSARAIACVFEIYPDADGVLCLVAFALVDGLGGYWMFLPSWSMDRTHAIRHRTGRKLQMTRDVRATI